MRFKRVLPAALTLAFACTFEAAPQAPTSIPPVVFERSPAGRGSDAARLVTAPGRASCHDRGGDVRSEGSGDRTGPRLRPPRPAQPGSDLSGFSVERYRSGMTVNFGTRARIPQRLPSGARLQYSFNAVPVHGTGGPAAVSAILLRGEWTTEVRDGGRYTVLPERPQIAGRVLTIDLEADEIPARMRGRFRWGALSEWAPGPPSGRSTVFSDHCPGTGFPSFGGTST